MTVTLDELNRASLSDALGMLRNLYEQSDWVVVQALRQRPFSSLTHLKHILVDVVASRDREAQLMLVRAHPELANDTTMNQVLTTESAHEQSASGLTTCSPGDVERIRQLNAAYKAKFGWPFILAVRGPRGSGLQRAEIIEIFVRRLALDPAMELTECLHNVHRIAELRLSDKFGMEPTFGNQVHGLAESVGESTGAGRKQLLSWMSEHGFDDVSIDATGHVRGVFLSTEEMPGVEKQHGTAAAYRSSLYGSHCIIGNTSATCSDRFGFFTSLVAVAELYRCRQRLPFRLEVVGLAPTAGCLGASESVPYDSATCIGALAIQIERGRQLKELGVVLAIALADEWGLEVQRAGRALGAKVPLIASGSQRYASKCDQRVKAGTLLVRCSNDNPSCALDNIVTNDDADLCVRALLQLFKQLSRKPMH